MSFSNTEIMEPFRIKRKRSQNWETDEKLLLQQLIAEYIEIIEDKRTDSHNSQRKRLAWARVLKRFNSVNKRKRDLSQIQFQWRNAKIRLKAQGYSIEHRLYRTRVVPKSTTPTEQDAELIIPNEEFEATECDIYKNETPEERLCVTDMPFEEKCFENNVPVKNEPIDASSDGGSSSLSTLQVPAARPISKRITRNKYVKSKDEYYQKELYFLAKQVKEKELQCMHELHEAKMKSLEMERDLKLRYMQEEHDARMKIFNENK